MAKKPVMHAKIVEIGTRYAIEDRDGDGLPDVTFNPWRAGTCRDPDTVTGARADSQTCCVFEEWHPDYDPGLTGLGYLLQRCPAHAADGKPDVAVHHALHNEDDALREIKQWGADVRLLRENAWAAETRLTWDGAERGPDGITRRLVFFVADTLPISPDQVAAINGILDVKLGRGIAEVRRETL